MTVVVFRRLRLFVTNACGNTAHKMVPERCVAGSERMSSEPPICSSLAFIAGIPTPIDIPFAPCLAWSARSPRPLSLTVN
jgi:hypothetical protein